VLDGGQHAVIDTFYIHLKNSIEVALRGGFEFANVRDAGIVHQGVDTATLYQFLKYGSNFLLVRYVTLNSGGFAASVQNFLGGLLRPT
jgi:hypothetical protein